ncbi:hypothetical protein [Ligilactobacillus agilis]|uniref:hypothetical protein n=1 Tax=Ligilactobacillus agilis TaxID=1601 RepID=UPI00067F0A27|nr:hypothetical protein [Ligilactobacillus agilis]
MNNLNDFKTALNSLWTDVVSTRTTFNNSYLPLSAVDRVEFNDDFRKLAENIEIMLFKIEDLQKEDK